jgi:uncharacterized Ntn-hydrolase superfamily protein
MRRSLRRGMLAIALVAVGASPALATWSVIGVDQKSGAVVIASATCVLQEGFAKFPARNLMDIQAIILPGIGVAAAQANVDSTRANQRLIYAELQKGTDPKQIVEMLKADPNIDTRQFGIVDLKGRSAGYSGNKNSSAALDRQDHIAGAGIYFSIQGNILRSNEVVTAAMAAFKQTSGALADRVMAAMEAADQKGGDGRCSCDSGPKLDAPCTAKTAHVAYILRAEKSDKTGDSFNDGAYAMYVSATNADIRSHEDANPVKTLRMRYEAWKRSHVSTPPPHREP